MKKIFFYLLLLISATKGFTRPSEIDINLDDPASTRFLKVYENYSTHIKNLLLAYKKYFSKMNLDFYFEYMIKSPFIPAYYKDEMQTMANYLNLTLMDVLKTEFVYEISTFCTTVVMQKKNKGLIFGRNLDYGPAEYLKKNVVHLNLFKNGKKIIRSTHFAGFHGFTTGVRFNENGKINYSFAMNQRESFFKDLMSLDKARIINFFFVFIGNLPSLLYFREILIEDETFDDALTSFKEKKLAVSLYVTLVEGTEFNKDPRAVVIARERFSVAGIISLDDDLGYNGINQSFGEKIYNLGKLFLDNNKKNSSEKKENTLFVKIKNILAKKKLKKIKFEKKKKIMNKENPFLVQTNHDWWLDPLGGNHLDDGFRRRDAINRIKNLYKNGDVNIENLFDQIMSVKNTKNNNTVFTTLVDLDYYNQSYDTRIF